MSASHPAGDDAMPDEATSKDQFFARLGELAEGMIAAHGKDFAMGTLVLAARFIAEGKTLGSRPNGQAT